MKKQIALPAKRYLHLDPQRVVLHTRVNKITKQKIETSAEALNTSISHFVDAALNWYIDQLKKEGQL